MSEWPQAAELLEPLRAGSVVEISAWAQRTIITSSEPVSDEAEVLFGGDERRVLWARSRPPPTETSGTS